MLKGLGKKNSMLEPNDFRPGRNEDYSKGFSDKDISLHFRNFLKDGKIIDNASARQFYVENVLRNTESKNNPDFPETVNMNYEGGPDYNSDNYELQEDFKKTASSVWVPNTTSPDPSGQREDAQQEDRYVNKRGSSPFEGLGTILDPAQSAANMTKVDKTLANFIKGSRPGATEN
jgi:hypothetical protein